MCGQHHDDLLTDQAYKLPDAVWAIPERDRAEKARFNSDLCQMGERYFIRCVLGVPFTESEGEFGWGAWAEVDWSTFERYLELYDEDGSGEPPKDGILANDLPPYPSSIGSPVKFSSATQPKGRGCRYCQKTSVCSRMSSGRASMTSAGMIFSRCVDR
jgi:hypothetical protein